MQLSKKIDQAIITEMLAAAQESPRKRVHKEIHDRGADSPIQWFLNVIVPGSYCAPHLHTEAGKWEWFQILSGKAVILLFDAEGVVIDRVELTPTGTVGVEIPPQSWHTIVALEPSALLELKSGPYIPAIDKQFASWAPLENQPLANSCELWYRSAFPGDRFTSEDIS